MMGSCALVLIDWENITGHVPMGKYEPEEYSREAGIKKLFLWIKSEVDEIFDSFVFAPLFMAYMDYQLLYELDLQPIACPKIPLGSPNRKDTVDETLIKKGLKWITHQKLTHICLVSGDSDFIPFLEEAKKQGLLVMIAALDKTLSKDVQHPSLSRELEAMADISPKTGQKMLHSFSPTKK